VLFQHLNQLIQMIDDSLPAFWFVAVRSILPNLARGVANRTDSASWGNSGQSAFSFFFRVLRYSLVTAGPFRRIHIDENQALGCRNLDDNFWGDISKANIHNL